MTLPCIPSLVPNGNAFSDKLIGMYDQVANLIDHQQLESALALLAGGLLLFEDLDLAHSVLREHRLHSILMEDPYSARAFHKPRGYAGDAVIMDFLYDQLVPDGTSQRGRELYAITTAFPVAKAVRERRKTAAAFIEEALSRNDRICSLACGHMRELDLLSNRNLSNITAVDQDALSIESVRARYPTLVDTRQSNVFHFLRQTISAGGQYDLIYTLGFTDYCDHRSMDFLIKLAKRCLTASGVLIVANFTPDHLARGWLEACLDWTLIYRDEAAMRAAGERHGLSVELWRDDTRSLVFSRMRNAA